ncbi:hypothetical protein ACFLX9_01495 [Chloroflexota bacterium]
MDEGVVLRNYLLILLSKWWIVVLIFAAAMGTGLLLASRLPPEYQARTQLLLASRISERLANGNGNVATNLSVDTLSNLAIASDLLEDIIEALGLGNPGSGSTMPVETLATMMQAEVQVAERGDRTVLPLLTMTVRGRDAVQLKEIADKWAELFIQRNALLFASESARSFDFLQAQYLETEATLKRLEEERKNYLIDNPLDLLRMELEPKQSDLQEYLATLLDISAQFRLQQQDYDENLAHLNELTIDGRWIGLQADSGTPGEMPSTTPEQRSVLEARQRLFLTEEKIQQFMQDSELNLLKQSVALRRQLLEDHMRQVEVSENNLKVLSQTLEALEAELEEQDQFLVLSKAIDDPALWDQLGINPSAEAWEEIREIGLLTEEVNPAFTNLTASIISTRTEIATERERESVLTQKIEENRSEIKDLDKLIGDSEEQLTRLQSELGLTQQRYKDEQATYSTLQTNFVNLRNSVRQLQVQQDAYQKLVDTYSADVEALSIRIASIELQTIQLDRQIQTPESSLRELASQLQEARLAKDEQASSILVVESAVVPRVSIGSSRQRVVLPAGAMGLFVGIIAALLVHYVQVGSLEPRRGKANGE